MSDIFYREFVAGIDPNTGMLGWKPLGVRFFEPRDYRHPFGVAHDTMEHPEKIDATLKNELQAQGAALYVRPSSDLPEAIAANIAWFYQQVHAGKFPDAPVRYGDFHSLDAMIRGTQSLIVAQVRKAVPAFTMAQASTVVYWMAYGYDAAKLRYHGIYRGRLTAMFNEISEAVTAIGTNARIGDRLVVGIEDSEVFVDRDNVAQFRDGHGTFRVYPAL